LFALFQYNIPRLLNMAKQIPEKTNPINKQTDKITATTTRENKKTPPPKPPENARNTQKRAHLRREQ
jgi:hypothetical protein